MFTVYFRFAAGIPDRPARAARLERLLARAQGPARVDDWRADALGVIAPRTASLAPASAAFSVSIAGAAPAAADLRPTRWAFIATPVHWSAGLHTVHMPSDGILRLEEPEIAALVLDFNRVFAGARVRLHAGSGGLLLCSVRTPWRAATTAPEELAGRDLWDCMPRGADAGEVRRLMTEIEMWLHGHEVNERRAARTAPLISGLWLWGGGPTDVELPAARGWIAGTDPLFDVFGAQAQYSGAPGSGVVVVAQWPGAAGWRETDERWLAPAAADLAAGRLQRLLLSAGRSCFSVGARDARRFWRRARPWWEYFRD